MKEHPERKGRLQLIELMFAGHSWQEALAQSQLHVSRATAYRLRQLARDEEQAGYHHGIGWAQSGNGWISQLHERRDQPAQEPGLLNCCEEQQAANPFVPDRQRLIQFFLTCTWF